MKVLLLSAGSSIHTVRWANALSEAGVDVVLASQHDIDPTISPAVRRLRLPRSGGAGYFLNAWSLRRGFQVEKPDLVNAHYASGYGTTVRLSGVAPVLMSVWGSDVFEFPLTSPLHRWLVRGNLVSAKRVASTSRAMAEQTRRVAPGLAEIAVTPFGVDTSRFVPLDPGRSETGPFVIGTVKTLKRTYGIDTLIDSFALLRRQIANEAPEMAARLRLRIVGDGPDRMALEGQAERLGIADVTQFSGRIDHVAVPAVLNELDVYVALSRAESFGVAIIEAGACGLPVVVSDVGGLPEVVDEGRTGFVVPREDPAAAAAALRKLVLDADLRRRMGDAARRRVVTHYEWRDNVRAMIRLYEDVIASSRSKAQ